MNTLTGVSLFISLLFLSSCTWVKPTVLSEDVQLVDNKAVVKCERLGTTTSYVKHTIGPFERDEEKVNKELVVLARNRAAEMKGNTIVALGPIEDGTMSFNVFWCAN